MVKRITSLDEAPVDVVEAVKRGFIHRGFIPRKYRRNDPTSDEFALDKKQSEKGSDNPDKPTLSEDKSEKSGTEQEDSDKDQSPSDNGAQEQQELKKPKPRPNDNSGKSEGPLPATDKGKQKSEPGENKDRAKENNKEEKTPEGGEGGTHHEMPAQNLRNEITSTDPEVSVIDSEIGSQESAKDPDEPEPGKTHEKLIDLTEKAHDVLYEAETVFPFTLFPDTITLDREKLSVAKRSFFRVAKIITVPITSLISAEADVGPFFGTVRMTSKYFVDNTHEVTHLWRNDATKIHRLLQGFIIAQEKGLDVTEVETDDLKILLEDLGQGVSD